MTNSTQEPVVVLHVDDDSAIHTLTCEYLARELDNIRVITAMSGDEALELLETTLPDCVILDYNMPGMNGLELLTAIRNQTQRLPVFMFTNIRSGEIASTALSIGATAFLQKGGSEQYQALANHIRTATTSELSLVPARTSVITTN